MPRTRVPAIMNQDRDGNTLRAGAFVVCSDAVRDSQWWWNWPGIVKSVQRGCATVEFLGFGSAEKRTIELPVYTLSPVAEPSVSARLYRVNNGPTNAVPVTARAPKPRVNDGEVEE